MNSIWKVGAAAGTVALLGGFYLGRVASDPGPLPAVGQPVTVGATVEPTPSTAETQTLRPRHTRTTRDGQPGSTATETEPGDDNGGDDNRGRGRGRGRGGDDDGVQTISPPPSQVTPDDDDNFDDNGGDRSGSNSGHG